MFVRIRSDRAQMLGDTPGGTRSFTQSRTRKGFPDMPPTTARQARRQSRVAAALLLLSFLLLLAMAVLTSMSGPS